MASPCVDFIRRHQTAADARSGEAKGETDRTKKRELTLKAEAHRAMVERASDGCGAPSNKYPGSREKKRCLCVALQTLPPNNNAPEPRVMRILVPNEEAAAAFVKDVKTAAEAAKEEDHRVRAVLEPVRRATADARKNFF